MTTPTLDSLATRIVAWQRETMPDASARSSAAHLKREAIELLARPYDGSEMADIFFLLVQVADRAGVDLVAEVAEKLEVNKARHWQRPDADGVVLHVRGEAV